jgi:intracellular sulfur oxidation DsrE/DsrF family protein
MPTSRPESSNTTPRRDFLGTLAASGLALTTLGLPLHLPAAPAGGHDAKKDAKDDPDAWFGQLKGKHRMILDVPRPHEVFPFVWPRVFLLTNTATGTPEKENNVVVVLRHEGIPYAFEDRIWAKYKLGEMFKIDDPKTKAPSTRNPFWKPAPGDYKLPGFGSVDIGIDQLQASGVMFCVCDAAMTVYSAALAAGINANPADVKTDWLSGLLPGVQPVPSGVWAIGRAQEHGCNYCFAG